mmetsp:Transcript_113054/g.200424  ORF Transcript_113054/g.200424 Transcript_113054/m.200424 type:complete len:219 (-) Transcript_113054:1181-1837(-)
MCRGTARASLRSILWRRVSIPGFRLPSSTLHGAALAWRALPALPAQHVPCGRRADQHLAPPQPWMPGPSHRLTLHLRRRADHHLAPPQPWKPSHQPTLHLRLQALAANLQEKRQLRHRPAYHDRQPDHPRKSRWSRQPLPQLQRVLPEVQALAWLGQLWRWRRTKTVLSRRLGPHHLCLHRGSRMHEELRSRSLATISGESGSWCERELIRRHQRRRR